MNKQNLPYYPTSVKCVMNATYMLGCFLSKSMAFLSDHISLPPVSDTLPSFDRGPGYTQQDTIASSVGA